MTRLGPLAHLEDARDRLKAAGLWRTPRAPVDRALLCFSSNDYLGLASRAAPAEAVGAGASRLVSGEAAAHGQLEQALADWLGVEACLLFSSGYAANVGAISALASAGDVVVSDALNHASLIDGARLSRARVAVTPHNDVGAIRRALEHRDEVRAWVVVESYYSMDADGPDLAELRRACDDHGAALLVDEAHALGVLGPGGRGRCADAGIRPDVLVGTLGKAFGGQGAFVAGAGILRDWLYNRARAFVFSTGLSPALARAARQALGFIEGEEGARSRLLGNAATLRRGLADIAPPGSVRGFGHVVPIVLGDPHRAVRAAMALAERGVHAPAIRPPTVPQGTARLRLTTTAAHQPADIERALGALAETFRHLERR